MTHALVLHMVNNNFFNLLTGTSLVPIFQVVNRLLIYLALQLALDLQLEFLTSPLQLPVSKFFATHSLFIFYLLVKVQGVTTPSATQS